MSKVIQNTNTLNKGEMREIVAEAERRADAKRTGYTGGAIASILAVLSIFTLGVVFLPIAIIVAIFSTLNALGNGNTGGVLVNLLAWVLIVIGAATSPMFLALLATLGFS